MENDTYLAVLRSIETNDIHLSYYQFKEGKWTFAYRLHTETYKFRVHFTSEQLMISTPPLDETSTLFTRKECSRLVDQVCHAISAMPTFRLKLTLGQMELVLSQDKYYIRDGQNFEQRMTSSFIDRHASTIKESFVQCMKSASAPKPQDHRTIVFVMKEQDELPLYHYLEKEKLIDFIATVNRETIVKIQTTTDIFSVLFCQLFKKDMAALGYNLYYTEYIKEIRYRFDSLDFQNRYDEQFDTYDDSPFFEKSTKKK